MKNHSLRKKHARDERRRQANARQQAARERRSQPVVMQTRGNVIAVVFGNTRPVMRAKSNIRYGNPRPMENAA